MKKIIFFLFLSISSFYNVGPLCAIAEGEVLKAPGEYKEPTSYEKAKKAWDETEENIKKAEKEREEADAELKKARQIQKEYPSPKDPQSKIADDIFKAQSKRVIDVKKIETQWKKRQAKLYEESDLIKKYTKRLGIEYERPVGEPELKPVFKEPSGWTNIRQQVNAWLGERQAGFYKAFGNDAKIVEIRQDLTKVYTDLGTGGFRDKAKNSKELAAAYDVLSKKIYNGLKALEEYKEAVGAVPKQEQEAIKKKVKGEVQEVITDLIVARDLLTRSEVDVQVREKIEGDIKKALGDFNITEEQYTAFKNKARAVLKERVDRLYKSTVDKLGSWYDWARNPEKMYAGLKSDPLIAAALRENNLDKIFEQKDLQNLGYKEATVGTILNTVRRGYSALSDLALERLTDVSLSPEEHLNALNDFLALNDRSFLSEQRYSDFLEPLIKKAPVPPERQELLQQALTEEFVKRTKDIIKRLTDVVTLRFDEKSYNSLVEALGKIDKRLDTVPVTAESLEVRLSVLKAFARIPHEIRKESLDKNLGTRQVAKVLVDSSIKADEQSEKLDENRARLVEQDEQGNLALKKIAKSEGIELKKAKDELKSLQDRFAKEQNDARVAREAQKKAEEQLKIAKGARLKAENEAQEARQEAQKLKTEAARQEAKAKEEVVATAVKTEEKAKQAADIMQQQVQKESTAVNTAQQKVEKQEEVVDDAAVPVPPPLPPGAPPPSEKIVDPKTPEKVVEQDLMEQVRQGINLKHVEEEEVPEEKLEGLAATFAEAMKSRRAAIKEDEDKDEEQDLEATEDEWN